MSRHFRPDDVVRLPPSRRELRRLRRRLRRQRARPRLSGTTVGVVIAGAVCAGLAVGLSGLGAPPVATAAPAPALSASSAAIPFFGYCPYGGGLNCVVDGDTFYLGRDKVRIAGIDAPETHPPRCAAEARAGEAATHRLRDLLNAGEVTLTRVDRDEDVYGRKLRNVAAGGADVGAVLIGEGLARDYAGGRRSWCG